MSSLKVNIVAFLIPSSSGLIINYHIDFLCFAIPQLVLKRPLATELSLKKNQSDVYFQRSYRTVLTTAVVSQ